MSAILLIGLFAVSSEISPAHNLHVSHGRLVIEDGVIVLRIRFFRHDLEDALKAFHQTSNFALSSDDGSDSLFADYANEHLVIVADDDTLASEIVTSGEERDIWWYELQYRAESPKLVISISNTALFDLFDDQQNIIQVLVLPESRQETLFFVSGSARYDLSLQLQ